MPLWLKRGATKHGNQASCSRAFLEAEVALLYQRAPSGQLSPVHQSVEEKDQGGGSFTVRSEDLL